MPTANESQRGGSSDGGPDDVEVMLRVRLRAAEAMTMAARHVHEIFNLVYSSPDTETARSRLIEKWNLDAAQADAILGMTAVQYTEAERASTVRRARRLRRVIGTLRYTTSTEADH